MINRRELLKLSSSIPLLGFVPKDIVTFDECCLTDYPCDKHMELSSCAHGCGGVATFYNGFWFCANESEVHWYPEDYVTEKFGAFCLHKVSFFTEWRKSKGRLFWVGTTNDIYEFIVQSSWVEMRYLGTGRFDIYGNLRLEGEQ